MIANLTLWFAVHVLFRETRDVAFGPAALSLPVPESFDWRVAAIAALAAILIFRMRKGILTVLAICAAAGLAAALV